MKNSIFLLVLFFALAACAPTPEQMAVPVSETVAAIPTATFYPTQTAYPTYTSYPTLTPYATFTVPPTQTPKVVVVTATSSPTPEFTPTITNTPTPTPDPLMAKKRHGYYLVGVEIAPGLWRSEGGTDGCYWSATTKTGDIIDNHFGMAGGTMYIPATAFQVEMNEKCGVWTYLGQ